MPSQIKSMQTLRISDFYLKEFEDSKKTLIDHCNKTGLKVPECNITDVSYVESSDSLCNVKTYMQFTTYTFEKCQFDLNKDYVIRAFCRTCGIVPMLGEDISDIFDDIKPNTKIVLQNASTKELVYIENEVDFHKYFDENVSYLHVVRYLTNIRKLHTYFEYSNSITYPQLSNQAYDIRDIIAYSVMFINMHGWISNKMVSENNKIKMSISQMISDYFESDTDDVKDYNPEHISPSENEYKYADHIIGWLHNRANGANAESKYCSQYETDLFTLIKNSHVKSNKDIALLCSSVNYYNTNFIAEKCARKGFLPADINDKVTLKIKIISKNTYNTMYGPIFVILAEDENLKYIKITTSMNTKFYDKMQIIDIGTSITVSGVIKNKETYKENDYTVLTRVNYKY